MVKYDPFNLDEVWVKLGGEFCSVRLSDLTRHTTSFEEYRASKIHRKPIRAGSIDSAAGIKAYREKQKIEQDSAKLTRKARRRQAADQAYHDAYPPLATDTHAKEIANKSPSPDYSVRPRKFGSEN